MAKRKRRRRTKASPRPAAASHPGVDKGLAAHRGGRWADAASQYRRVLDSEPDNADAWHLLGVVSLQQGNAEEAADMLRNAIAGNGAVPAYHDHLGLALRQQGLAEEAEAHHRRALEIAPDFAPAHNNLAGTLKALDRLDEAERAARRAVELAPGDSEANINLGQILFARGRALSAVDAFKSSMREKAATPEVRVYLGLTYQRLGRRAEAETEIDTAVRMNSTNPATWMQIGGYHLTEEDFDAAEQAFSRAMELAPEDANARVNRGIALWRGGKLGAAESVFLAILDDDDKHVGALLGSASIAAAMGRDGEAHALYRRVLEADPGNVDAYNNLNAAGGSGLNDADAVQLSSILAKRELSDDNRAKAAFALAGYLRRSGEMAAAFDLYKTANEFKSAAMNRLGRNYDPEVQDALVAERREMFTEDFFRARRDFGVDSDCPVLVIGMPRSGTTLVEQILASHSQVFGAGERRDMAIMGIETIPAAMGADAVYPTCLRTMSADVCSEAARTYVEGLRAAAPEVARIVDKMPFNFLHVGLAALAVPGAKIIHCRRDMRDVGLSCYFTNFADAHPWSTDLGHIGHFIAAYERLMVHWRRVLPVDILDVVYEDLVADLEGESRRMIRFIGLDWEPACLAFHATERAVSTAARAQVRRPIYTSAVGRWKAFEAWLGPLTGALENSPD